MLETTIKQSIFRVKEIWFSDRLFDVQGYDTVIFRDCPKMLLPEKGFKGASSATLTIDLTQEIDHIWMKFDKKSCRYDIEKAIKNNVHPVKSGAYQVFYDLNKSFRKEKNLNGLTPLDYLTKYTTIFLAYYNQGILAGQAYLEDDKTIRWLLGASIRLQSFHPLVGSANRLLIWEAIKYAKKKNIQTFDLGGYYQGQENRELLNINFFKESFGGVKTMVYSYQKDYTPLFGLAQRIFA